MNVYNIFLHTLFLMKILYAKRRIRIRTLLFLSASIKIYFDTAPLYIIVYIFILKSNLPTYNHIAFSILCVIFLCFCERIAFKIVGTAPIIANK